MVIDRSFNSELINNYLNCLSGKLIALLTKMCDTCNLGYEITRNRFDATSYPYLAPT